MSAYVLLRVDEYQEGGNVELLAAGRSQEVLEPMRATMVERARQADKQSHLHSDAELGYEVREVRWIDG